MNKQTKMAMETLETWLESIPGRLEVLARTFVDHDLTAEKIEQLTDSLENAFRRTFDLGELPDWAESLRYDMIDWHDVIAENESISLESFMTDSTFDVLYLDKTEKETASDLLSDPLLAKRLELIAGLLTAYAETGRFIVRIRPECFVFLGDKMHCRWDLLDQNSVSPDDGMIDAYETGWMHPALRKREIPNDVSLVHLMNHTFIYLILYTLTRLPIPKTISDFRVQIDRFRVYNPDLPPLFRPFFRDRLLPETGPAPDQSPLECFKEFETLLADIDDRMSMEFMPGEIECKADSAYGRNKRTNDNEDAVFMARGLPKTHALAGVADGVSTASLGSGWLAGSTVKKTVQRFENKWIETIMDFPDMENNCEEWDRAAEDFLTTAFELAHHAVIDEINAIARLEGPSKEPGTMSSTLVMALICGNRAVTAHWGDSRAYLVNAKGIVRLTEDHNNQLNALGRSRQSKKPFQVLSEGADHLTRTVGACRFSDEENRYIPIPLKQQPVAFNRVNLYDGEYLLLCSDGLLSGVSRESEAEKEQVIWSVFQNVPDGDCREIALRLVRTADDDRGDDNISAVVLKYSARRKNMEK